MITQATINDNASPASGAEDATKPVRTNKKGEQIVAPSGDMLTRVCMDGTYFSAVNPTMGTGIAASVQATFVATNALAVIRNMDTTALPTGKQVQLDYMRLICTAAGTGTTAMDMAIVIDPSNRYSSGGTALTQTAPRRSGPTTTAIARVDFGAVTCAAAGGSARTVSRLKLKHAALVVGDEFFIAFGGRRGGGPFALNGAAAASYEYSVGPVSLDPSATANSCVFHVWYAGVSAAPSFECEFGLWER